MNGSFEIEVAQLRGVLKDVVGVVEARNTVPVLSNVLLTVDHQSLTVTGTDLDLMVQRRVPLAQAVPFTITVEAGILDKIATKLPSEADAKIKLADGKLTVSAGRSRFRSCNLCSGTPANSSCSRSIWGRRSGWSAMRSAPRRRAII